MQHFADLQDSQTLPAQIDFRRCMGCRQLTPFDSLLDGSSECCYCMDYYCSQCSALKMKILCHATELAQTSCFCASCCCDSPFNGPQKRACSACVDDRIVEKIVKEMDDMWCIPSPSTPQKPGVLPPFMFSEDEEDDLYCYEELDE